MPWWLSEMQVDIKKPRESTFGLSRSSSFKPLIDGQYQRAMAAEERRIGLVADSIRRSTRSSKGTTSAGEDTFQVPTGGLKQGEKEQKQERGISTVAPQATLAGVSAISLSQPQLKDYSPRDSTGAATLVESKQQQFAPTTAAVQQNVGYIPTLSMADNNLSAGPSVSDYELPGATVIERGDNPHYYGTPPPEKAKINKDQFGEVVDTENGDIFVDIDKKEVFTRKKKDKDSNGKKEKQEPPQRPLALWEKVVFGRGNEKYLTVKDTDEKDKNIPLKKIKIEPKVFFANERTFISWLQFCALLLTVALSLLNFGDSTSRIAGGIFIGISAVVAIYALYRFEKRAW